MTVVSRRLPIEAESNKQAICLHEQAAGIIIRILFSPVRPCVTTGIFDLPLTCTPLPRAVVPGDDLQFLAC